MNATADSGQAVFTYGSLMFAPVWQTVCEGQYQSAPATLKGYTRCCVRGESYPAAIAASPADEIVGLVYFNVSAADLLRLDQFEGTEYTRREQEVAVSGAEVGAGVGAGAGALDRELLHSPSISALFYEFNDHARVEQSPWNVNAFATVGIKAFLARHVQGFIQTGSRQS